MDFPLLVSANINDKGICIAVDKTIAAKLVEPLASRWQHYLESSVRYMAGGNGGRNSMAQNRMHSRLYDVEMV